MIKKIVNKILNVFGILFISGFLILGVLYVIGLEPRIVLSGSMEPAIHTGSLAFVNKRAEYDEVKEGDIIAYRIATGATVTHRAISVTEYGIETKGDSNKNSDGISTTEENFKGETLFSIPYLGYAFAFIQTKRGKIIMVTAFILYGLLEIATSEEKKEEKIKETLAGAVES